MDNLEEYSHKQPWFCFFCPSFSQHQINQLRLSEAEVIIFNRTQLGRLCNHFLSVSSVAKVSRDITHHILLVITQKDIT